MYFPFWNRGKTKATTLARYIYCLHKKIINNFILQIFGEMYENIRANVFIENIFPCIGLPRTSLIGDSSRGVISKSNIIISSLLVHTRYDAGQIILNIEPGFVMKQT